MKNYFPCCRWWWEVGIVVRRKPLKPWQTSSKDMVRLWPSKLKELQIIDFAMPDKRQLLSVSRDNPEPGSLGIGSLEYDPNRSLASIGVGGSYGHMTHKCQNW